MTIKMPEVKIVATGTVCWPPVEEMRAKLKEAHIEYVDVMLDNEVLEVYKTMMGVKG